MRVTVIATSLSFLLLLLLPLSALGEIHNVVASSRITGVTVFRDRAQVTRSGQVALKAGMNVIAFDSLPQLMAEDSVRVEGKGNGRAQIAGVTVKKVYLERVQEERVRELEEEIAAVNRKIATIDARRKGLAAQEAFIDSIRVGWSERISKELAMGKPTTAELGEAARFVGEGVGKIEEQLNDTEVAKKPLLDRVAALKKELEQNRRERMKEVRSVLVTVEAEREMNFAAELSYIVVDAHWEPTYDVRLSPDGKEAELTYRAQVWQRSGEDWKGVKLALSTASPEVGGTPPELTPWHVSLYEPPVPMPLSSIALGGAAPAPTYGFTMKGRSLEVDGGEPRQEWARPVTAEIGEGQTAVVFTIVQPADVPADGTRSGSTIAINRIPVTAQYQTVPKLSSRVYLKSEVVNSTSYPLLPGQVNVFNDASFTGKAHLSTVSPGEKFDLYFGADNEIKVKREMAKVRKQAGLISSNSVSYHCKVELQNFKKRAVTVSLLDQLPLPGNAEIKVNLEDASPKPDETKADGIMIWKLALAPGEKRTVSYDIVIEYPKGRNLTGAD